jgi:glycosyltransferase involved in cell wall biosynthesis
MKSEALPLITVCTLCYNTGKDVIASLESVKIQNYPNIQHIIVDDCSTDKSVQLLEDWIRTEDYQCTFIKHEINRGINYGLTEVLNLSTGHYLAFTSDDLWVPGRLFEQVSLLKEKEKAGMVYGDTSMIDENGQCIYESLFQATFGTNFQPPSGDIFKHVVKNFFFYLQAALIDLKLFKTLNFIMDGKIISEDWDWQLTIARNAEVYGVNKVYAIYRRTNASVTSQNWKPEKMHMIHKSHFYTIGRYYDHPKNNEEDVLAIADKLRSIFGELTMSSYCTYTERVSYSYKIYILTKKAADLTRFLKMCLFGSSFIVKMATRLK